MKSYLGLCVLRFTNKSVLQRRNTQHLQGKTDIHTCACALLPPPPHTCLHAKPCSQQAKRFLRNEGLLEQAERGSCCPWTRQGKQAAPSLLQESHTNSCKTDPVTTTSSSPRLHSLPNPVILYDVCILRQFQPLTSTPQTTHCTIRVLHTLSGRCLILLLSCFFLLTCFFSLVC